LSNFTFATILSLAAGIYLPIFLGIILGVVPVLACYQTAVAGSKELLVNPAVSHTVSTKVSVAAAEIAQK
jgi:putative membrane protein